MKISDRAAWEAAWASGEAARAARAVMLIKILEYGISLLEENQNA